MQYNSNELVHDRKGQGVFLVYLPQTKDCLRAILKLPQQVYNSDDIYNILLITAINLLRV